MRFFFVLDLIRTKDKKACQPAPELRKWLAARAEVAMAITKHEEERYRNDAAKVPDLQKDFEREVGIRLTIYRHRLGKEMWLECDPIKKSLSE